MDPSSPSLPLDGGEIADEESKEFDDGYDENLMGDEEDRKKLALMTEKEREQELFNRSERRETLKIRFEIERKLRSKAKKREQEKKQSKQVRATKRLRASEIYSSDESSEESDEYTPDNDGKSKNFASATNDSSNTHNSHHKSGKTTSKSALLLSSSGSSSSASNEASSASVTSASSDSGSSDSGGETSDDDDRENDTKHADSDRQVKQDDFIMTLNDLKTLQLKRDKIESWIYSPFFNETAVGLFVKISVGNHTQNKSHMYKVAQITDIIKGQRVYPLAVGKNKTDKQCKVIIGRVERTYLMSFISNQAFDDDDYNRWRDQVNIDGQGMPDSEYFKKKKADISRAINYQYNDEDIRYEITERGRFKDSPYNFAMKKTELMGEKADAEAEQDYEKAQSIQRVIDELEEKARQLEKTRSSSTFSAISFVNERNRYKNIVESERVLKESKSVKTEDPFTRRKCTPMIVHNRNNNNACNNNNGDTSSSQQQTDKNDTGDNQTFLTPTHGAKTGSNNGNDSKQAVDSVKPVHDLFLAHADLELDIDI